MILKMVGCVFVLLSSTFIGFSASGKCSRRPVQLRELQSALQMLENEISFMSNILADAFMMLSRRTGMETGIFFKTAAELMMGNDGINACDSWETSIRKNISKTALNFDDELVLNSFGKMLGSSDLEGQINNIRHTIAQLKLLESDAEEMKKKNAKMYRVLGTMGGLAVIIILF